MSLNIARAIAALHDLASSLGPRHAYAYMQPRAVVKLGPLPPEDFARVVSTMTVTWDNHVPDDRGMVLLDAHGHIGNVGIEATSERPETDAELLGRIDRLRAAVEQRQKDALVAVAMDDLADRGAGGGR